MKYSYIYIDTPQITRHHLFMCLQLGFGKMNGAAIGPPSAGGANGTLQCRSDIASVSKSQKTQFLCIFKLYTVHILFIAFLTYY